MWESVGQRRTTPPTSEAYTLSVSGGVGKELKAFEELSIPSLTVSRPHTPEKIKKAPRARRRSEVA
jgi:hypothetical protein